jgi:hypothetical protein
MQRSAGPNLPNKIDFFLVSGEPRLYASEAVEIAGNRRFIPTVECETSRALQKLRDTSSKHK